MGLRNYVLKNNEKPATHFIEVWRSENGSFMDERPYKIRHLKDMLSINSKFVYTIAIFKIRMK